MGDDEWTQMIVIMFAMMRVEMKVCMMMIIPNETKSRDVKSIAVDL